MPPHTRPRRRAGAPATSGSSPESGGSDAGSDAGNDAGNAVPLPAGVGSDRQLRPGLPPSAAGGRRAQARSRENGGCSGRGGRGGAPVPAPFLGQDTPRGRWGLSPFFPQRVRVTLARCSGCWWPWPVVIALGTGRCLNPDNVTCCKPAGERTCYFFPKHLPLFL